MSSLQQLCFALDAVAVTVVTLSAVVMSVIIPFSALAVYCTVVAVDVVSCYYGCRCCK